MTHAEEIVKLDLEQAKTNFEIETDPGRHDPHDYDTIASIVICGQCPHYRHLDAGQGLSLCKGKKMYEKCTHNTNLKASIDKNETIWAWRSGQILELVKEKITEMVL